jgi:hypothetical protein
MFGIAVIAKIVLNLGVGHSISILRDARTTQFDMLTL